MYSDETTELDDQKLYKPMDLRTYLKSLGLPHSRPKIIEYEKDGIIPKPVNPLSGYRVYYGWEIKKIAETLRKVVHENQNG